MKHSRLGFTIIELLVVIAVIGIIATTTVAVFTRFNQQQNITIAAKDLNTALAEAKSDAISHVVINCNNTVGSLRGYRVVLNNPSTDRYSIQEVCRTIANPTVHTYMQVKSYTLPSGVHFSSSSSPWVIFKVLGGGIEYSSSSNVIIVLTNSSQTKTITVVNPSGVIQ